VKIVSDKISKAMKELGYSVTFHGLRKSAAARLAEAGCSIEEIAAITGHKTLAMIQHYTKEAEQKKLAANAMAKMEKMMNAT